MQLLTLVVILAAFAADAFAQAAPPAGRPNVVVIVADDLGYGDVGAFGQKVLKTPNLDRMAAEGMRFTQFYVGAPTWGVARHVLLTGRHVGRGPRPEDADDPVPAERATILSILELAGYAVDAIGDWPLPGRDAPAELTDAALEFIARNRATPFCLLLALDLRPGEGDVARFAGNYWPPADRAFAARLHQVDDTVGRILARLKDRDLDRHTLVILTSMNGPTIATGRDLDRFDSNGRGRGLPGELFEGIIRVPMIAWWPGTVPAGTENDRQWWAGDVLATVAELAGVERPKGVDGGSMAAALRGQVGPDKWKRSGVLYWETHEGPTAQAIRFGKWKAIRSPMLTGEVVLYDMSNDVEEKRDYAKRRADLTRHATNILDKQRPPEGIPAGAPGK